MELFMSTERLMFSNEATLTNQLVALKWSCLVSMTGIVAHQATVYLDIGQRERNAKYFVDRAKKWIQRDDKWCASQIRKTERNYNGN